MANTNLSKIKYEEFVNKYSHFSYPKLKAVAKYGDLQDFRLLCNSLMYHDESVDYYYRNHLDCKKMLTSVCSERIEFEVGLDFLRMYAMRNGVRDREYADWKNTLYTLFGYNLPTSTDISDIKCVVQAIHSLDRYSKGRLSSSDLIYIIDQMNFKMRQSYEPRLWSTSYDCNDCKSYDDIISQMNDDHIAQWVKFTDLIWEKNFEAAYIMMSKSDDGKDQ